MKNTRIHDFFHGYGTIPPGRKDPVFLREHPSLYWLGGKLQLSVIYVWLLSLVDSFRNLKRKAAWKLWGKYQWEQQWRETSFKPFKTPDFGGRNIAALRDYKMDLRQVITDNALKDTVAEATGVPFELVSPAASSPKLELGFKAVEVTETRLCSNEEMHIGYQFEALMLMGETVTWTVERLCSESNSGRAVSPNTKLIRTISRRDGDWYDDHITVNADSLKKVRFD